MSPHWELSRIFPLVAFYFHPSIDLHHVSQEGIFMDFVLNGLSFSSLRGFIPCLLKDNFYGFCPQWFCIVIPQWIPYLLRVNFYGFYPQWFFFYFKSLTVLSSKGPFLSFFVMRECVGSWASTYKWFLLLAFDLWCLKATKLKEGYCRHPNLYRLILMVLDLNDDNLRSLIRRMCVKNHPESSRKRVQKLPFDLRGVRPIWCGVCLQWRSVYH